MENEDLVEVFKRLGFPEYEAKCYLALYQRDSLAVGEVAKLAEIPRTSAYDALKQLMIKGYVAAIPGKLKRYAATNPKDLKEKAFLPAIELAETELDVLERKRNEKIKIRNTLQNDMESVISQLNEFYMENQSNSDPLDYIEILKNPLQIHRKYLELYSKAQYEILSFTKPPFAYVSAKQLEEQQKIQADAAKRNVSERGIIQLPPEDMVKEYFDNIKSNAMHVEEFKGHHEYRIIDELPIKLFIFDNKTCFFALEDPIKGKTSLTMLIAEHEAMAKSFRFLFESFWEKARDYYIVDGVKYYLYPEYERKRGKGGKA